MTNLECAQSISLVLGAAIGECNVFMATREQQDIVLESFEQLMIVAGISDDDIQATLMPFSRRLKVT